VAPRLYGPPFDAATTAAPPPATSLRAHTPVVPETVLGKRPREAEDTHDDAGLGDDDGYQPHPRKKGKGKMAVTGVLEAAGTTSKTRHRPGARTPADANHKSKTAGCGAGRLAATTAQEVYHQHLQGPSVQQVLVGATTPRQLIWVEGSVAGGSQHHHSSVVQQESEPETYSTESDGQEEQEEGELFNIPKRLKERQRALLAATPADWKRKAVDTLKCRLCPGADFSDWEDYKRHCDTAEAHPAKISYCNHCGDFFARGDALKRHCDKRPGECIDVTADVADRKRSETDRVHKEFEARLELHLRTGKDLVEPFSWIIKAMFPGSSKKGSREQSRLAVARKSKPRTGH
jgi:hypothetical protein